MVNKVAIVLSGFPRRSETFALNELLALDRLGVLGPVFATKPGEPSAVQPGARRLVSRVELLPAGDVAAQADAVVARLQGTRVRAVHGYFAHRPAEVAELAARRLGIPFGFSVHARDARKVEQAELARRANAAACVIACNPDVAREIGGGGATVLPHGVDLQRFTATRPVPNGVLRVLAVGRLVEKKGFETLIQALHNLGRPVTCTIVGDGPDRRRLAGLVHRLGLDGTVHLPGALTHDELPSEYRTSHVVAVPSVEDATGDRDGLPNVVLEALACGRAVVGSDVAALGSALSHETTGLLVPPGDVAALRGALVTLADAPALRERLGVAGRQLVERKYELSGCAERVHRHMEHCYG
jgi:glycosyltransferase involved in cell wall biosynthesis